MLQSLENLREIPFVNTRFSLSIVNSYDELDRIVHINESLQHFIGQLTYCFRHLLLNRENTEERPDWNLLNNAIGDFIEGFNVIYKSHLEEPIPFSRSWYAHDLDPGKVVGLSRIITSVLQTQGRAVVIGPSLVEVDIYIRTLCFFLRFEQQTTLSRQSTRIRSPSDLVRTYCPHVWLQGFSLKRYDKTELKNAILGLKSELLMAPGPTTLIDLYRIPATTLGKPRLPGNDRCVKVVVPTLLPHRFRDRSRKYLENRTQNLRLKADGSINSNTKLPVRKCPDSAVFVQEMFSVLFDLPLCMRKNYLLMCVQSMFLRSSGVLEYMTVSLGKLIEFSDRTIHYRTSEEFVESAQGRIPYEVLYPQSMLQFEKRLTDELLIQSPEDLYALLSLAERVRPNLYVALYGNPIIGTDMAEILRYVSFT